MPKYLCGHSGELQDTAEQCGCESNPKKGGKRCKRQVFLVHAALVEGWMRVLDDWLLTAERIAVHLPSRTAVVADLHLGYAEARRRSGEAVPDDALDEQLSGLGQALQRHGTRRLVVAGDLLE